MIDATKFAKPSGMHEFSDGSVHAFRFAGNAPEEMAAELHKFADAVAKGHVLLQSVQTGQKASLDDYAIQGLYIEFAEADEVPRPAMGHNFPVMKIDEALR